ncbi:hypothetical protein MBRA1_000836 [Malassezia brasiliensis]|uniref:ABC1 atypical kinase-like domain-containing protein n=1 Tax=Malassezia brasiliensis TaxID=1821822 RepID=A0AAF0IRS1_9BASI|nr:hypothetical protein MBRA1_000836 [Malassezia brasiliensis]
MEPEPMRAGAPRTDASQPPLRSAPPESSRTEAVAEVAQSLERTAATAVKGTTEAVQGSESTAASAAPARSDPITPNTAVLEDEYDAATEERTTPLRAARVPSSRLGRLLHYGSLGAGLAWGSAGEYLRRATGPSDASGRASPFLSEANVNRLVDKLSTMRGAALKLGQFLSIQDSHMLPPQIEQVMLRVQNSAHYMPAWQLDRVMRTELGDDWRASFASFDERPFAAASIGQVHNAVLADPFPAQPDMAGRRVAVKVQFPGVADSISSDLANIKWLLMASSLLPKGLFLENSVRVLKKELEEECDYTREAEMGRRFRAHVEAGGGAPDALRLEVPRVIDSLCTPRVLTTEFMRGRPLTKVMQLDSATRDRIGLTVMDLSLRELFEWRLMQTDPNWTNFLYSERNQSLQLIDFGATRPYTREFMDAWISLLRAAVAGDREACEAWSIAIGYLNGKEPETMRKAHVDSMVALGEPFRATAPQPFPFANQTITDEVRAQIPVMLRERLRPPPPETYSLNRKLSGAFLLCARLGAHVDCRALFERITNAYVYSDGTHHPPSPGAFARGGARSLHTQVVQQRLGRNLTDMWARYPLDEMLAQKIAAKDRADPNMAAPRRKIEFVGRAATEPTLNYLSSEQIRPEAAGTVRVRGIDVPLRPNPPGAEDCCMSDASPPITTEEWDPKKLGALPGETSAEASEETEETVVGTEDRSLLAFFQLEQRITRKQRSAAKAAERSSEL